MHFTKPKVDDHEAKMARAELYRLAQYSAKLFKMIDEKDELDGWVQSKITKAADYISSVYHYLEYEQMANSQIESGPRTYEEQVQEEVKISLHDQWTKHKQGL